VNLTRPAVDLMLLGLRGDPARDVELMVLRHRVAVRKVARLRRPPGDRVVPAALARVPREGWAVFLVTAGLVPAWHVEPVATRWT